jgi:hypothetical protein
MYHQVEQPESNPRSNGTGPKYRWAANISLMTSLLHRKLLFLFLKKENTLAWEVFVFNSYVLNSCYARVLRDPLKHFSFEGHLCARRIKNKFKRAVRMCNGGRDKATGFSGVTLPVLPWARIHGNCWECFCGNGWILSLPGKHMGTLFCQKMLDTKALQPGRLGTWNSFSPLDFKVVHRHKKKQVGLCSARGS